MAMAMQIDQDRPPFVIGDDTKTAQDFCKLIGIDRHLGMSAEHAIRHTPKGPVLLLEPDTEPDADDDDDQAAERAAAAQRWELLHDRLRRRGVKIMTFEYDDSPVETEPEGQ